MLRKKIVLFGGAFSPIHLAHIEICQQIKKQIKPDLFFIIPYKLLNNHKKLLKKKHRIKIIKNAIKNYPYLKLSLFELNKKQISYSYKTCQYFKKKYPQYKQFLVLGTDSLNDFFNWKSPEKILNTTHLIHLKRKGEKLNFCTKKKIIKINKKNNGIDKKIITLAANIPKISSSKIRNNLINNKDNSHLLEQSNLNYFKSLNLNKILK